MTTKERTLFGTSTVLYLLGLMVALWGAHLATLDLPRTALTVVCCLVVLRVAAMALGSSLRSRL